MVHRASFDLGAAFLVLGAVLGLASKQKLVGSSLAAGEATGISAGKGWLK